MVINHLLTGMILQVVIHNPFSSQFLIYQDAVLASLVGFVPQTLAPNTRESPGVENQWHVR